MQPSIAVLPSRFTALIMRRNGCWEWIGARLPAGYGRVAFKTKNYLAHRAVYELLAGPIPSGLTLDHLCRNRACVNPAHLEPVDHRTNVLRGIAPTAVNARRIHCIHGHLLSASNTYATVRRRKGYRQCIACSRQYAKDRKRNLLTNYPSQHNA